jgi:hypothetical protein
VGGRQQCHEGCDREVATTRAAVTTRWRLASCLRNTDRIADIETHQVFADD